nr:hypothetical protein [Desulfacinum infernum]
MFQYIQTKKKVSAVAVLVKVINTASEETILCDPKRLGVMARHLDDAGGKIGSLDIKTLKVQLDDPVALTATDFMDGFRRGLRYQLVQRRSESGHDQFDKGVF